MVNVKKLLTKMLEKIKILNEDVIIYEYAATTSFAAGTIGTRGAQVSFFNPAPSSYYIRSVFITFIANSNQYIPIVFYNTTDNKFYINFYRATTSAVNDAAANIRIVYTKTQRGGSLTT